MSGHSKWSKIKRQKGAADQKRGALFTKLANVVTLAARQGGGDPNFNFQLRLALDSAKAANMPKNNIERAIKRGTGELEGVELQESMYEAYGPGGVAMIIEVLTDNKNRTVANVKHLLSKHGGNLGSANSVLWMFERKGVLRLPVPASDKKEYFELAAIEAGAEDLKEEEGLMVVLTQPENLQSLKESLEKNYEIEFADVEWLAKETVNIEENKKGALENLIEALDDDPDTSSVYTNHAN